MARCKRTPKDYYGDKIRVELFGDDYHGVRSPTWLAEKTGLSVNTLRSWKKEPGRIPAWQYLRIKQIIGD